jgi:hypothetical protein
MKRRAVWIVLILLASGRPTPSPGQTAGGAAFLKIGVGARALGMGGSFAAVADEAGVGYWNPEGLDLFHRTNFADIRNILDNHNLLWVDADGNPGGILNDPSAYSTGRRATIGLATTF